MTSRLLIIDDDARLCAMLASYLEQNHFVVSKAGDGRSGLAALQGANPAIDLVILDLMLPDMDGLDLCRAIRAMGDGIGRVAVLMLTAKGDPMDRILGLEIGADDYLAKPFEPRELLARIKAILRRQGAVLTDGVQGKMQFGRLEIDRDARTVTLAGAVATGLASSFLAGTSAAKADTANTVATIANNDFILNFL